MLTEHNALIAEVQVNTAQNAVVRAHPTSTRYLEHRAGHAVEQETAENAMVQAISEFSFILTIATVFSQFVELLAALIFHCSN
jgi:hypothetical protein